MNENSMTIEPSFQRYLAAKVTVDNRALNQAVWKALHDQLSLIEAESLCVLEIGAGIGTMIDRMMAWQLIDKLPHQTVNYTAIDEQEENIAVARDRLSALPPHLQLRLERADVFEFATRTEEMDRYNLLIAHAFLDLVDIPNTLRMLRRLLKVDGLLYLTLNFDGITSFQPEIDPPFDAEIEVLYHRTMDERITNGNPSGDSHSGRHLFNNLREASIDILAAGSSDWIVFGGKAGYPADEAYFLHFIINTMYGALKDHPNLDPARFEAWIETRHQQIDAGELTYIAHQIDFLGSL